jgi:glycosyltransferase involved in cell wall biosynthesis
MKVCILVHNNIVHDPRVIKQADALSEAGYDVTVMGVRNPKYFGKKEWIAGKPWKAVWFNRDKETIQGRINWFRTAVRSHLSQKMLRRFSENEAIQRSAIVTAYPELVSLAALQQADIYHANELNMLPVACEAAKRFDAKVIYDSHEFYTNEDDNASPVWQKTLLSVEGKYIKQADAVTTVCDSIADELQKMYSITRPVVIRNLPLLEDLPINYKQGRAKSGTLKVVYSVYLVAPGYNRGINQIIEAAPYLDRNIHITIRGNTSREARLQIEALIEQYSAASQITLASPVDPSEVIRSASYYDVGLVLNRPYCLSFLYSLPTKLFEYLMAGLAVVGFDVPEVRRVISAAQAGLLCESEPRPLAEALNFLARNPDLLATYQCNSRRAATEEYNWETEKQKLLSIYQALSPSAGQPYQTERTLYSCSH